MGKIDKSGLPGRFKAWLYQHAALPRIMWPLTVYSVPITTMEAMERKISGFLRRWLGLPHSLCSTALYGTSNVLLLPFKSLTEEFKVSKIREALQYRESNDPMVSGAGIETRTGRKWKVVQELKTAESRLRIKTIIGTIADGKKGLGYEKGPNLSKVCGKERRALLLKEVKTGEEEKRLTKMVGMGQQGAWTKWTNVEQRKFSWNDLWRADPSRLKFLIQATYDTLPSPTNLHLWGLKESPACQLCNEKGTLQHVLSGCRRALSDGRYKWRHDKVLEALAEIVSDAITNSKFKPGAREINFVRAGEKPPTSKRTYKSLLSSAPDWQLKIDVGSRLKFPSNIIDTSLHPNMVLFSNSSKQVILYELTVPWEEYMDEAHERKANKYQELVESCRQKQWQASCYPIEVGARGFAGKSLYRMLGRLGLAGTKKTKAIKNILETAEKASRWIFINREKRWGHT